MELNGHPNNYKLRQYREPYDVRVDILVCFFKKKSNFIGLEKATGRWRASDDGGQHARQRARSALLVTP